MSYHSNRNVTKQRPTRVLAQYLVSIKPLSLTTQFPKNYTWNILVCNIHDWQDELALLKAKHQKQNTYQRKKDESQEAVWILFLF